ncbi:hypothetical protein BSR28_00265 [Boudabousia liubingyangii]|uniref:MFS transporter n=1 Tax=Boudabousia liubingyangii TaxID=1921764 RepID=UPI00093FC085|nr:MFS transporter [Boudabousia liubingyangii]OKL48186.1 hypothetical protein BSR28_00265 [Boudabousia liubingyangii]
MGSIAKRNGFTSKQQISAFLTVVFSGQVIYSAFESLKIPFYERLVTYYGLTDTQFGMLFMMLGVAVFFYIPGGWINNRFNTRTILIWGLIYRLVTALFMILVRPHFYVMMAITFTWGVLDAIYWPAVIKGVALLSGEKNKGFAFGVLTAFRAGGEATLNGILIGVMAIFNGSMLAFQWGMVAYALIVIPMILLIQHYVPTDAEATALVTAASGTNPTNATATISEEAAPASSAEALQGLILTLKHPRIWVAGIAGLCVYWVYTVLVYTTPLFVRVYQMSSETASTYATVNALALGLTGGIVGGLVADHVFKSSTVTLTWTLGFTTILMIIMAYLPKDPGYIWVALVATSVMAFVIMMSKAIQQAPVAELDLPDSIVGSAMSVNSFMAFACILWAMPINGAILDATKTDPGLAFKRIFLLMALVAAIGAICSAILQVMNRKANATRVAA